MRIFFMSLLAVFVCFSLFGQTDKALLSKFDSLEGWSISEDNFKKLLKEHYEGDFDKFLDMVQSNVEYPELEKVLGSQAIVLAYCEVYKDSSCFKFRNKFREGFRIEVEGFLEEFLNQGWEEIPEDGLSMNLSFSFTINNLSGGEGLVSIVHSLNSNPSIYKGVDDFNCFNQSDKNIYKNVKKYSDKRVSLYFLREYLQRNPFSKNAHSMYQKLIEG